jgi:hypothetical protein
VAGATHASDRITCRAHIEGVGKCALDGSGKNPVNKDDKEIFQPIVSLWDTCTTRTVIANPSQRVGANAPPDDRLREAIQGFVKILDCFRLRAKVLRRTPRPAKLTQ